MTISSKRFVKRTLCAIALSILILVTFFPVFQCPAETEKTAFQKQHLKAEQEKYLKEQKKRKKAQRERANKTRPSERITADQAVAFPVDI